MQDLFSLLQWGPDGWADELAAGTFITITLSLATLPVGIAAGLIVSLGKQSPDPLIRASAQIYTTIFRGIPELLTLFVVYYGAQLSLSYVSNAILGFPLGISPFVAAMVALGLVLSGYSSEVFSSAFKGIPRGQYEAASALGMHRGLTFRRVIFPQLVRIALPGLSNLWLNVLKDTALVSVISLNDLLRETSVAVGTTKEPFFFYGVACLIYLILSVVSSVGIWRIEATVSRGGTTR